MGLAVCGVSRHVVVDIAKRRSNCLAQRLVVVVVVYRRARACCLERARVGRYACSLVRVYGNDPIV